jgi:hypothetical protein
MSNKLINWIRQSFEENGKVSSKRMTLFAATLMLGYVVVRYTDHDNSTEMAIVLVGLIGSLVGITVYGVVNKKESN